MSYILDALKKAESERKLGSVPNVYMEPLPIANLGETLPAWHRPWTWVAATLLAAVGVAAVWMNSRQPEVQPASVSTAPLIVAQAPPVREKEMQKAAGAPGTARSYASAPNKDATATVSRKEGAARNVKPAAPAKPSAAAPVKPATEQAVHAKAATPEKAPTPAPLTPMPAVRAEPVKNEAQAKPASATPVQPAPEVQEVQVAALRDLPDHIRRSIPPVSIGGYIYSPNPAERSMLLNNRLIREGEQAASGLILEKMMPKEAVLSYQGQRFRLAY